MTIQEIRRIGLGMLNEEFTPAAPITTPATIKVSVKPKVARYVVRPMPVIPESYIEPVIADAPKKSILDKAASIKDAMIEKAYVKKVERAYSKVEKAYDKIDKAYVKAEEAQAKAENLREKEDSEPKRGFKMNAPIVG